MHKFGKRTWAQIDLDALAHNVALINAKIHGSKIMAIVKADAYGHGAPAVAVELQRLGVDMFGVSSFDEALQLRRDGISSDILILGYTDPEDMEALAEYDIIQTVFDESSAQAVYNAARRCPIRVHVKADTGMNRIGFKYGESDKIAEVVERYAGRIRFEGLYTHFASSDEDEEFTREQFGRFTELAKVLEGKGISFKVKHCCNSGGIINYSEMGLDYVRCGLILYGLNPSENAKIDGLKPVMTLYTTVAQVHALSKGDSVSYGRTFTAERDMTAAAVPVGYADGFSRLFSGKVSLLHINSGSMCPVLGRICMDQSVIDVSECGNVQCGDRVIVFGGGSPNSADSLASLIGTINYEIVCLVGKRVPRIYIRNGEEVDYLNYIANV